MSPCASHHVAIPSAWVLSALTSPWTRMFEAHARRTTGRSPRDSCDQCARHRSPLVGYRLKPELSQSVLFRRLRARSGVPTLPVRVDEENSTLAFSLPITPPPSARITVSPPSLRLLEVSGSGSCEVSAGAGTVARAISIGTAKRIRATMSASCTHCRRRTGSVTISVAGSCPSTLSCNPWREDQISATLMVTRCAA